MVFAFFSRTIPLEWLPEITRILHSVYAQGGGIRCHQELYDFLKAHAPAGLPQMEVFGADLPLRKDTDIFVSLGGDGTFLQALQWVRDTGIPIVGINFGHLGFLAGADAEPIQHWVELLMKKQYTASHYQLLEIVSPAFPPSEFPYALNEVSVQRQFPQMMEIEVSLSGQQLPVYRADGLIVATPTGSTAYSLSVGGPIVFPDSRVLLLSPIAPHNLNLRTIVIPDDQVLELRVRTRGEKALLCADNRSVYIESGSLITIKKADFVLNSLNFPGNSFVRTLRQKLLWGFDKRNNL